MKNKRHSTDLSALPACAAEFIRGLVRKMRHRRDARDDVQAELAAHFEDELRACISPEEREQKARHLVEEFGDLKLLAVLCRRAKKRCRPLWAKVMVRTVQGLGVFLLLFCVYWIWFISGRPSIKVDYLALLNQWSRAEIAKQDNAWPHYQRAIALLVEPPAELAEMPGLGEFYSEYRDLATLSEPMRQAVAAWVEANRSAWAEFQAATAQPYCWRPYEHEAGGKGPWLLSLTLPHVTPLRRLALVGIWHCRMEALRGRPAGALEDCLVLARAGRHWQQSELLIEQLVGLRLSRTAHEEILHVLSHPGLSAADLKDWQRKLAAVYPGPYPLMDLEGERMAFLDVVQHVFTDGGPGGGHLVPDARQLSAIRAEKPEPLEILFWNGAALLHAGREQTVAKADEAFDLAKQHTQLTPYEVRNRHVMDVDKMLTSLPNYRYFLVQMLVPAVERASALAFQGRALHEATLTILALQRYRLEKGSYPGTLGTLQQAGYLAATPADPYSSGPLVYKAARDGFMLYSIGPDFHDGGGELGADRKGCPQMWADHGDAVFWPAP